jgi:hypothetical protein
VLAFWKPWQMHVPMKACKTTSDTWMCPPPTDWCPHLLIELLKFLKGLPILSTAKTISQCTCCLYNGRFSIAVPIEQCVVGCDPEFLTNQGPFATQVHMSSSTQCFQIVKLNPIVRVPIRW